MLDVRRIRTEPEAVQKSLERRGKGYNLEGFLSLEAEKRQVQSRTEALQARRNAISKEVGQRKQQGLDAGDLLAEMQGVGPAIKELGERLKVLETRLEQAVLELPNLPHASVPDGNSAEDNPVLKVVGEPPVFDFAPQAHWDLGPALGLDFDAGARVAGARFTVLRNTAARLSRALIQLMLDLHTTEHGYEEILPPFLVHEGCLLGTGQLPKFEEDLFRTRDDPFYLIPTAEVPLTNLVREGIVEASALPMRLTAWTACFRREAGAAGRDTRGLIRQHQFDKVELVQITTPETSYEALEEMTGHAEEVLRRLELPFRRVALCCGDMGFSAAKTYDLEVWLPGQGCYREISSCSNTEDFQARRMKARYRSGEGRVDLVHTLNGSGVAVGRALVAVLENFQQADGSVVLPDALRPYMGGLERIQPKG
ncbi:MAG: serine--tRNA ligase [Magnetococcales bacterium]|nr:serine--tRNA ligase [Magnetococcales bacterium]